MNEREEWNEEQEEGHMHFMVVFLPQKSRRGKSLLSIVSVLGTQMIHLNDKKKNYSIVTTVTVFTLAFFVIAAGVTTTSLTALYLLQSAQAYMDPNSLRTEKAPAVVSGDNIYVVWWTDKGTPNTNGEVMFRASNDGGATFGNKTNLSNSDTVDSVDAEIAAEGATVMVTWWERNQTNNMPVARISTDAGETFGPM
ncbi:MAG: hypothetical protein M3299_13125, partial [Thermoproteota archaeon]|nr:hypothetical protein [Thermoproteota archaeon]